MKPEPLPKSAIAKKLLKYVLVHPTLVVKSWRNRLYFYSSGTTFAKISGETVLWMTRHEHSPSDDDESESQRAPAEKILKNVSDCWCRVCVCVCVISICAIIVFLVHCPTWHTCSWTMLTVCMRWSGRRCSGSSVKKQTPFPTPRFRRKTSGPSRLTREQWCGFSFWDSFWECMDRNSGRTLVSRI